MRAFLLLVVTLCGKFGKSTASGGLVSYPKTSGGASKLRGLKKALTKVYDSCVPGRDSWHFIYTFDDGCVLQGFASTSDLTLEWCQGPSFKSYPPIKLDISCTSPYSKAGYSAVAGFGPVQGEHPAVAQYTIKTLETNDCECAQYCSYGSQEEKGKTVAIPKKTQLLPS